jgi:hypothetical protein
MAQLWAFLLAPLVGGALGGLVYGLFVTEKKQTLRTAFSSGDDAARQL